MVKIIATLIKLDVMSHEEFTDYWLNRHGPLVRNTLPGLRKYVINTRVNRLNREWAYDGVSELWFDDVYSIKKAFASNQFEVIREDEKKFLKSVVWIMTEENFIVDRT